MKASELIFLAAVALVCIGAAIFTNCMWIMIDVLAGTGNAFSMNSGEFLDLVRYVVIGFLWLYGARFVLLQVDLWSLGEVGKTMERDVLTMMFATITVTFAYAFFHGILALVGVSIGAAVAALWLVPKMRAGWAQLAGLTKENHDQ